MALKQLILSRKIESKRAELLKAQSVKAELDQKRAALQTRESELEDAVREITDETEEAVKAEVEAAVSEFEAEVAQVEADQAEANQKITDIQSEIDTLQSDLDALNEKVEGDETETETAPDEGESEAADDTRAERKVRNMNVRSMFGSARECAALFAREDVKDFAKRVRELGKQKRAVSGGELLIPEIMLPMIREQVEENSKLLKYVNLEHVGGTARETIMGTIPEAVWTEMCANINELELNFNDAEVDGYKVGGYIPVCNALLEDNDVNLVSQVLHALAVAIAIALDKAIIYGTGTKMPKGIVTRLAETSQPENYPATARTWADLHTSNIQKISADNSVGVKLFQQLVIVFGAAKKKYGAGGKFWAMNEKTHTKLIAEAMNVNAAGAIVAGIENTMPVIGGDIVELDFIPDNNIVAGYGALYLLAERAGVQIAQSEHIMFIADKTVFKGTARYDGKPVIGEGFVLIGIDNTDATTSVSFAHDGANAVESIRLNTHTGAISGTGTLQLKAITEPGKGTVTWTSSASAKATVSSTGLVTGVTAGTTIITATCNGLTDSCTVTVS